MEALNSFQKYCSIIRGGFIKEGSRTQAQKTELEYEMICAVNRICDGIWDEYNTLTRIVEKQDCDNELTKVMCEASTAGKDTEQYKKKLGTLLNVLNSFNKW